MMVRIASARSPSSAGWYGIRRAGGDGAGSAGTGRIRRTISRRHDQDVAGRTRAFGRDGWAAGYDPLSPETGARAYLSDLPDAELHLFDTGHFALEEMLPQIAPLIADFLDRIWA
jgi:hypothetical protein